MADGFRRSPLFLIPCWAPPKPRHRNTVRRSCLSCHFHPIVSILDDNIRALQEWHAEPPPLCGSPEWIATGLERIDVLLAALADLLLLPQAQEPLRSSDLSPLIDRLANDFLRLADAHGSFRDALTELKSYQTVAQIALRQNDEPRLASAVQSQRQVEKEFIRLAAGIREVTRSPAMAEEEDSWEAEMAGIMRGVTVAAAAASRAVMVAVAKVSRVATEAAACETRRQAWGVMLLWLSAKKKAEMKESAEQRERERAVERRGAALNKMEKLEECIEALESSSERVYRTLLNTRASLLNFLTPSLNYHTLSF